MVGPSRVDGAAVRIEPYEYREGAVRAGSPENSALVVGLSGTVSASFPMPLSLSVFEPT